MARDPDQPDGPEEDEDRRAILARRNRLIAIAFSGLTGATGCYESHMTGNPPRPRDDAGIDAGAPVACLSRPLEDSGMPGPCLGAPLPMDASPGPCLDTPLEDAGPTPCLEPPDLDAGPEPDAMTDAMPGPCLTA